MFSVERLSSYLRKRERGGKRRRPCRVAGRKLHLEVLEGRIAPSVTPPGIPAWVSQGPQSITVGQVAGLADPSVVGAVSAIAVDPDFPSDPHVHKTVYIGTVGGGIWKATDVPNDTDPLTPVLGPTWKPLTDQFPSLSITALALDDTVAPGQPRVVWAGTGSASSSGLGGVTIGVLKSTDGGDSWQIFPEHWASPQNFTIHAIVTTSTTTPAGHVVFVASDGDLTGSNPLGGLERSTDGGNGAFVQVSGTAGLPFGTVTDLKVDPNNPNIIYAAIPGHSALPGQGGVFRGDFDAAGNLKWTPCNTGLTNVPASTRIQLAVSKATDPATHNSPVYAAVIEPAVDTIQPGLTPSQFFLSVSPNAPFEVGDSITITTPPKTPVTTETAVIQQIQRGTLTTTLTVSKLKNTYSPGSTVSAPKQRLVGLFRSADHGTNWTPMPLPTSNDTISGGMQTFGLQPGGQGDRHFSMVADTVNPQVVYVGGDRQPGQKEGVTINAAGLAVYVGRIFRGDASMPAATAWTQIVGSARANSAPHADSRAMVISGSDLLEADDGGIYRLSLASGPPPASGPWQSLNGTLAATEFYSVAWDADHNRILGGAQDVGDSVQSAPGSVFWDSLFQSDGAIVQTIHRAKGNIIGASNASPIVITATAHGLTTGQTVVQTGVLGNSAANGTFTVTFIDADHYSLAGSTGNGTYTSGGTYTTGPDDLIYSNEKFGSFTIQTGILTGNPMLTFTNGSPPTITRAAGDWVADGFQVGQKLFVTNSTANDDFAYTITGFNSVHTANDTLRLSTNDVLAPEGPHNGVMVTSGVDPRLPVTNGAILQPSGSPPPLTFTRATSGSSATISRPLVPGTGWIVDGFVPSTSMQPVRILVSNAGVYSGTYTIATGPSAVTATTLTLDEDFPAGSPPVTSGVLNVSVIGGNDLARVDKLSFVQPFVTNSVNPDQLLFGTSNLYETNPLPTGQNLGTAPAVWLTQLQGGNQVGQVNAMVYGGHDATGPQPTIGYVGTDGDTSGNYLFVRQPAMGPLGNFVPVTSWVNGTPGHQGGNWLVRAIATDPNNWQNVYVLDDNGLVWFSPDGGKAPGSPWTWVELTRNIDTLPGAANLQNIAVVNSGGTQVVLVGGQGGVFRLIDDHAKPNWTGIVTDWTEYGSGLPNALVTDLRVVGNRLLVGTLGRGAWMIPDISTTIAEPATLSITGTSGADDILLQREAKHPWLLDIFEFPNLTPTTVPLASIDIITIGGGGGSDTITIDASNGPIAVDGILIDGGGSGHVVLKTPAADSPLALKSPPKVFTSGSIGFQNLDGTDAFGQSGHQSVTWTNVVNDAPKPVALASPIDILFSGLTHAAVSLQRFLIDSLRGTRLPAVDAQSFILGLGGAANVGAAPLEDLSEDVAEEGVSPFHIDSNSSILRRLIQEGVAGFSLSEIGSHARIADPSALRQALDNLDNQDDAGNPIPANVNNVTLDTTTDVDGDGHADTTFHVKVVKHLEGSMALDVNAGVVGSVGAVQLHGEAQIGADISLDITFGVDSHGFFIRTNNAATPELSISNLQGDVSGSGRLGFLGVDADGTLAMDPQARIAIHLNDPGTDAADGLIRFPELDGPGLVTLSVQGDAADGLNDDLVFTGSFSVSQVPGLNLNLPGANVRVAWPDLTAPLLVQVTASDTNGNHLLDFQTLKAQQVLDQLFQLRDRLGNLTGSAALNAQFQLAAGKALGDLFNAGAGFSSGLLSLLVQPGSGDPVTATGAPAGFQTIQQAVGAMIRGLHLDPSVMIVATYDSATGELRFHVPLSHTFAPLSTSLDLNHVLGGVATGFDPIPLTWTVTMGMDFDFGFLLKSPQPVDSFFVKLNNLSADLTSTASPIHVHGNFGPLALTVDDGSVVLSARATVTLTDPTPDGRLSLADLGQIVTSPTAMHLALSGSVAVSAGTVQLFPGSTGVPSGTNVATVTGFHGSLDLGTGVLTASADTVALNIGTALQVTAQNVSFVIDPSKPNDAIATIASALVTSPDFPQLTPVNINNVSLFRDGFTLANITLSSSGLTLKGIVDVENLVLQVNNVTFRTGSGFTVSDLVLTADRGVLFPTLPVSARLEDDNTSDSIHALTGHINLQTGGFSLQARKLFVTLGGLVQIDASLVDLTFDPTAPGSATLLQVNNATATLSALTASGKTPTVTFSTFGFHKDGSPFVSGAQLNLPTGYSNALGIAGLLPLQINTIGINFPNPNDLNSFTLTATGQFLMQQLQSRLGFTPTIQIGAQSFSTANNGVFNFTISVDSLRSGQLSLLDANPITLGIANLTAAGVTYSGQITLGGYVNGVFNGSVSGFLQATTGPRAGIHIDALPGSTLIFDGLGGGTLDVLARATLQGGVSVGNVSGSVSGSELNFELKIVGTRTPTTPFFSFVVTPTFSDLSINEFTFQIANVLSLTGHQLNLTPNSDPTLPDATLNQVDVSFPNFPLLSHAQLTGVKLFDDGPGNEGAFLGFDRAQIDTVTFTVSGNIGAGTPLANVTNLQVKLTNVTIALPGGGISAGSIAVVGGSATLLPNSGPHGVASASNITGSFNLATGGLTLTVDLTADVNGVEHVTATGTTVALGPGTDALPLLSVPSATLQLPLLGSGVEMNVANLEVARNGSFSFTSASLRPGTALDTIGLGKLLPFKVTSITLTNNTGPRVQLDNFNLRVQGTFNFSVFSGLPVQPIVHLGGLNLNSGASSFDLTFGVNHGDATVNLNGPVTLGFAGLHFGPVTVGATVTVGHFLNQHFVLDAIGASLDVRAGTTVITASGIGTLTTAAGGNTTLHVNGIVGFSFNSGPGPFASLNVQNFQGNFTLDVTVSPTFQPVSSSVQLLNATVGSVNATFGPASKPLLRLDSSNVTINLSDATKPLLTFGALSASLPGLPSAFANTTGTVSNFSIGQDLSFIPSTDPAKPFRVVFSPLPSPQDLGLPAWFPIRVDTLGLQFGPQSLAGQSADDLVFIISGGLVSSAALPLPVEASVSNLLVNVGKLAKGELLSALQGLDGFSINVPELKIGDALTVGGGLGLGLVSYTNSAGATQTALYGRLSGHFEISGIGAGVQVILSEFGPLLAKVDAPLAVPLGPTGILMTGVSGGFQFGGPVFTRPNRALDLLANPTTFTPINLDDNSIRQALLDLLHKNDVARQQNLPPVYSWSLPFTMALRGEFSTVATPGILTANLNVAANVGKDAAGQTHVTFLGSGDAELFGIQLGAVGALIDLTNPLAPAYDLAFAVPSPMNPLAFLFPSQATFELSIRTDGLIEAPLIGLHEFANQMAGGTLNILLSKIADTLRNDMIAGRIKNPSYAGLPLVRSLGFLNPADITASELRNRLLNALPLNVGVLNGSAVDAVINMAKIGSQLANEVFDVSRQLTLDQGQQVLAAFESLLTQSAKTALQTGWSHFNPSLKLTGSIQPVILGIPFGRAEAVDITIDKQSIGFGLTTSIHDIIRRLADAAIPLSGFLVDFLSLGITDSIDLHFSLGLGDVFGSLLGQGTLPAINPFGQWDINFGGSLAFLGFNLASVRGAVFSPASRRPDGTLDTSHIDPKILKVFNLPAGTTVDDHLLDSNGDGAPDLIPIDKQERYNNLVANGGVLLTSQLFAPALLLDPAGVIQGAVADGLFTAPTDPTKLPTYIDNLKNRLLADKEFARMQLYVPGFASILNIRTDQGFAAFALKAGAQTQALMNTAYMSGFMQAQLLSISVGRASIDVSAANGLQADLVVPWLGLHTGLSVAKRNINFNSLLQNIAASVGVTVNLTQPSVPMVTVPIPTGAVTFALNSDTVASMLSSTFGLPSALFGQANAAQVQLSFYSPAFGDPADGTVPLVQRNGGVQFDASLNIQNLVNNAQFHFEAPLFSGNVLPNFKASATVSQLAIPGLQNSSLLSLTNFQVGLVKDQTGLSASLAGHVGLFSVDMTAAGTMRFVNGTVFGAFQVDAGTNKDFGSALGFKLNGNLLLMVNSGTTDQMATLPNGQTRTVPPGARLRVENGTLVVGGFTLTGNFDLQVSGTGLSVTADATVQLFGLTTLSAKGTLQVLTINNVTGLVVDVALAAAGSAAVPSGTAAPSLAVPGPGFQLTAGLVFQANTFGSQQPGLRGNQIPGGTTRIHGTGSLQLASSFALTGTFDVSVSGTGFNIDTDASMVLFNTFAPINVLSSVTVSAAGRLQIKTINGVLGLVVDVALGAAGAAAVAPTSPAPTLTVAPQGVGFALNAGLVLQVNSFGSQQPGLRGNQIPANTFRVHGAGNLQLKDGGTDSFGLAGSFDVTVTGAGSIGGFGYTITADATVNLFGTTLSADGTLTIATLNSIIMLPIGPNGSLVPIPTIESGLVVDTALALASATGPISPTSPAPTISPVPSDLDFTLTTGFVFQVNTFHIAMTGLRNDSIPASTLRVRGMGDLQLKNGAANSFLLSGTFDAGVSNGNFFIGATSTLGLLGNTLTANGRIDVFTSTLATGQRGTALDIGLRLNGDSTPAFDALVGTTPLGFNLAGTLRLQVNTSNRSFRDTNNNGIQDNGETDLAVPAGTYRAFANGDLQIKNGTSNSFKLHGTGDIRFSSTGFSITTDATLALFGVNLTADGTIDIFTSTASTGQRGIAADIALALGNDTTPAFDAVNGSTPLNFRFSAAMRLQVNATNRNFRDLNNDGNQDVGETNLAVSAGTFRMRAIGDLILKIGSVQSFSLHGTFLVTVSGTSFTVTAQATTTVLGLTMTVNDFSVSSTGVITMSVTGSFSAGGYNFGSVTLDLSKVSSTFRLELPSSRPVRVNLGFISVSLSGFVDSTGNYSFSGSTTVTFSFLSGTFSATVSDNGFSGKITGTFPGSPIGVDSAGNFTFGGFTFNIGDLIAAVGFFKVEPSQATIAAGEHLPLAVSWTVPVDGWHTLNTVDIRLRDDRGTVLWVRFDEAKQTFQLVNPQTGKVFGPVGKPGTSQVLHTAGADLSLAQSRVVAAGPTAPTVTLILDVSFQPPATGRTYKVEVLATDDLGHVADFSAGGTLTVTNKNKKNAISTLAKTAKPKPLSKSLKSSKLAL